MATPLTLTEVFPDAALLADAIAFTPSEEMIAIPLSQLPALSGDEIPVLSGNAGEFIRSVCKQAYIAQQARPLADRPTKFVIAQQQGVTSVGINAVTDEPEASHQYLVTTVYPVGSSDAAISPEPEAV